MLRSRLSLSHPSPSFRPGRVIFLTRAPLLARRSPSLSLSRPLIGLPPFRSVLPPPTLFLSFSLVSLPVSLSASFSHYDSAELFSF